MEAAKLGHYDVEYFIPLPKVEHKKSTIALLDPNICNSEFGFYLLQRGDYKNEGQFINARTIF